MYNPKKYQRKSTRLQGYDYSQSGLYFVTIICQDRAHLFGSIEEGIMHLNEIGQIATQEWLHTQEVRDNILLHEFVIMPNHIHGIVEILYPKQSSNRVGEFRSPSQTIGSIVRGYKIATIKRLKDLFRMYENPSLTNSCSIRKGELQFAPSIAPSIALIEIIKSLNYRIWQRNYYDRIIRHEKAYHSIRTYICNNPLRWEEDMWYTG